MKNFKNLLFAGSLLSLVIFASCDGSGDGTDDSTPSVGEVQAGLLEGTWVADFTSNDNAVTFDGQSRAEDWTGFSLTFSGAAEGADEIWGGNYNASGQPSGDGQLIWPGSGTWDFPNATSVQQIIRSDGEEVTISSVTDTQLVLSLTVDDPNARVNGFFDLEWRFTLTKQ